MPYTIQPLEKTDIPTLMSIGQLAFTNDTHTRMKMHEKGVDDLASELEPLDSLEYQWSHPTVKMMKAVDEDGKMVGFSSWRMWNFDVDLPVRSILYTLAYFV